MYKRQVLPLDEAKKLLIEKRESDHFVEEIFRGLYYKDEENRLIDVLRTNIAAIRDQYKKAIAMTALIRACTKKRPRGIFTYTGDRYNDCLLYTSPKFQYLYNGTKNQYIDS